MLVSLSYRLATLSLRSLASCLRASCARRFAPFVSARVLLVVCVGDADGSACVSTVHSQWLLCWRVYLVRSAVDSGEQAQAEL
jgi:hypothetical protein